jgi:hypothetical protein
MSTRQFTALIASIAALVWVVPADLRSEEAPARYGLTIRDLPSAKQFELTLRSLDHRPICVEIRRWPNRFGRVHFGSHWVILHTGKGIYPAINENFGRCVGPGCIIHIAPGKTLTGFIRYSAFGNEKQIAALPSRRLQVDVEPVVCSVLERMMEEVDTEILKR